ncbi:pentatricopeptide repeat domain-containing protein [Diplocarpon rosae]|nr:pentatricopeptide repeat domain-containing protein [Diplocarpon rosae]
MSIGARVAKRGKAVTFASSASTPKEPLLFLYPRWIRQSSSASPTTSQDGQNLEPLMQAKKAASVPKFPAGRDDDPAVLHQRFNSPRAAANSNAPTRLATPPPMKARPPDNTRDDGTAAFEKDQEYQLNSRSPEETSDKSSSKFRTFIKRMLRSREWEEKTRKSRIVLSERKSASTQTQKANWRVILEVLTHNTPDQREWPSKSLKFEIPPSVAHIIMHGIDDHFLEFGDQYGCLMELGERDVNTRRYTTFGMSGSATSIIKCAAEILRIASDVNIAATGKRPPNGVIEQRSEIDGTWSREVMGAEVRNVLATSKRRRLSKTPPEQISRPERWTQLSFLDYVTSLTLCGITSHVNRYGFGLRESSQHAITRLLRELFQDPSCIPAITRAACHVALEYFMSCNLVRDARILFVRMEIMKLEMTPRTFNIMLAGAAKVNDLNSFHFILHLMRRRGIAPNGKTWTYFLMAVDDVRIKFHILTAMRKKGLLNHIQTSKDAVFDLVQAEVESSLSSNQSQAEFIAHMDTNYGPAWLSLRTGNRILKTLGAHGLFSRCWEFLHFMESRNFRPDHFSINIVLHYCKEATNLTGAVELLRSLPGSMKYTARAETTAEMYRMMFHLAWRARSYNVAKVVWRYACLAGATSFRMRNRIFQSMRDSNRVEEPRTAKQKWFKFAGPVIIGLHDISEHPSGILEERLAGYRRMAKIPDTPSPVPENGIEIAKREQISLHDELLTGLCEQPVWDAPEATSTEKRGDLHTTPTQSPAKDMKGNRTREYSEKVERRGESISSPDDSLAGKMQTPNHEVATQTEDGDVGTLKAEPTSPPSKSITEPNSSSSSTTADFQFPTSDQSTTPSHGAVHPPLVLTPLQINDLNMTRPEIRAPWGPSTIGKRTPAYKLAILKEYLKADLEIFKDWKPERPFEVLLAEALREDDRWKAAQGYRGWGLEEMLDGRAIGIRLRSKKGRCEAWWR